MIVYKLRFPTSRQGRVFFMKRTLVAAALAIAAGFPLGWIMAMLATPILWRLEPVLHIELAGHSGPSDWVFYVGWAIIMPALFGAFLKVISRSAKSRTE